MKIKEFFQKHVGLILFSTLITSYAFVCMTKYCFASAMVFIVDEGYMTSFQTGLITAAFWLVYAVTQLFGGFIADKWHPEWLITLGLITAGISNVLVYLFYDNYILTLIIWMLNAFFQFGVWPSVFRIISAMYSGNKLTTAMMIATLASPAGLMMSYAVAAVVPKWQGNFVISFVGLFLMAVVWTIAVRVSGGYFKSLNLNNRSKVAVADVGTYDSNVGTVKLLISSGLLFAFLIAFFRAVIENAKTVLPTMINESYSEVDPVLSTFITLIPLFCSAAAPIISSILSKKFKNELKVAVTIFAVMLPISLVTLMLGRISYWWMIASMAAVTFGASCVTFFIITLVATKFNKWGKGATVAGLLNCFTALGNVAASALITWIAERFSWAVSMGSVVVMIAISLILAATELPIWSRFKKKHNV